MLSLHCYQVLCCRSKFRQQSIFKSHERQPIQSLTILLDGIAWVCTGHISGSYIHSFIYPQIGSMVLPMHAPSNLQRVFLTQQRTCLSINSICQTQNYFQCLRIPTGQDGNTGKHYCNPILVSNLLLVSKLQGAMQTHTHRTLLIHPPSPSPQKKPSR